jgi:hypothetical protein
MRDIRLSTLTTKVRGILARAKTPLDVDIDSDWYVMRLQEELTDLTKKYLAMTGRTSEGISSQDHAKKEFSNEISDVLCLTLLLADRCKINLKDSIQRKWYAYAQ